MVDDLDDAPGDCIEEAPVMADGNDGAAVAAQVLLEPLRALDVEVIRGLVEEQEVGLSEQERRQRGPALLAAAEGVDRPLELGLSQAQAREHRGRPGLVLIAAALLVFVADALVPAEDGVEVLGAGVAHLLLKLSQLPLQVLEVGEALHSSLPERLSLREGGALRQVPGRRAAHEVDPPVLELQLTEDGPAEGGLAGAVGADEPDAVALIHGERDALENQLGAVVLGDVVDDK